MANGTWLYVAVLYGAAVAFARRANVDLPRRVAVLFYALVLAYLWQPLTRDVTIIAGDVVKLTPPWSELHMPGRAPLSKYEVSNLNLQDVPMQIAPWLHQVREAWKSGEVPLWNAANGCGYPLLANAQSTPLAPLRLLTLPLPFAQAMTAECALKLLLALTLTYLFCRRRHSHAASILAAIAYGFSTWMTIWLQFPITGAAMLLPGVMLAIDLLLQRVTRPRFIAGSLIFAAAVLSGHPETVFQVGLFAAAFGLWVAFVEKGVARSQSPVAVPVERRPLRAAADDDPLGGRSERRSRGDGNRPRATGNLVAVLAACIVAALLSSPFLVPFAEAVTRSQRLAEVRETPEMTTSPLPRVDSAILLLQPRFFGELPIERPWRLTVNESICGFSGVLAIVAAIAAPFFLVRRWRDPATLYLLMLIVSVGVVLNWAAITAAFQTIAGLAPSGRMRLGICWFASLLVAFVVDAARQWRVPLLIATAVAAALMLFALQSTEFPTPSHRASAVLSLLPSMAVLLAIALLPLRRHFAIVIVAALTLFDLWIVVNRWDPRLPTRELYPRSPLITTLQQLHARDPQPFRILGIGGQLYPNTNAMFGFDDVRPHDPMASRRFLQFLQTTVGWEPRNYYEKWIDTATPLIDALNAKYVITEPQRLLAAPRYVERYAGRDGRIYENRDVLPLFYPVRHLLTGGDVRTHTDWRHTALVSRLPRRHHAALSQPWSGDDARVSIVRLGVSRYRLRIHAPRTTLIVSSIAWWPGWRADDFPLVEVNGGFLGFVVPAGEHEVNVAYRPLSFYVAASIALVTLAVLLIYGLRQRKLPL
jgi:hypothetical protein